MKQNILIADSGSTKTDWAFMGERFHTQGINPFHQDDDTIRAILKDELLPNLPSSLFPLPSSLNPLPSSLSPLPSILFYGSGVRPELEGKMRRLLREVFPQATVIEAHSDLLGACVALCGHHEGIACILGTGANSCLYDGRRIVMNTPPLGYILGDEGSGAVLGIRFLNALYKSRLPQPVRKAFEANMGMDMSQVIERVYRQPMANRWLASLSTFIHDYICEPAVEQLVIDNFCDFIRRNIVPYNRCDLPVNAVGSIAFYYSDQLAKAVKEEGYTLGKIVRSPLDALVEME